MLRFGGAPSLLLGLLVLIACTEDSVSPNGPMTAPQMLVSTTSYPLGDAVRLNMLWRVPRPVGSETDYMTTYVANERDLFGAGAASLIFYVPADSFAGTTRLYRLFGLQVGVNDHMPSLSSNEGGYATDAILGFPWNSQSATPGLTQLVRTYKTWDHALEYDNEVLAGYNGHEYMSRYGYRRYNTSATNMLSLSTGGVSIGSNLVAGCSLWSWVWNGLEFVNVRDYGRQIQAAFAMPSGLGFDVNPTEAGSWISRSVYPADRQGSPCLAATNTTTTTQVTKAIPLEWEPSHLSGDSVHPVIWKDVQLGKEITLDYLGLGPVAKYTTTVSVPQAIGFASVEIPSLYLNGNLANFYTYDAATHSLTALPLPPPSGDGTIPASGYGGVIVATTSGSFAFGQYGVSRSQGGSVSDSAAGFTVFYFRDPAEFYIGPSSNTTAKMRALYNGSLAAGENRFTTYLISGTLTDVRRLMDSLYAKGAK